MSAWPQTLEGIGEITTRFENPIEIDPNSILFGDEYIVRATFASVTDAMADAKGPYVVPDHGPQDLRARGRWQAGLRRVVAIRENRPPQRGIPRDRRPKTPCANLPIAQNAYAG